MKIYMNKIIFVILLILFSLVCIIKSSYTMEILGYCFLFSLILFGSYALSYFFRKKVEQTIPLYFLFMFVYLYMFGMLNILIIGYYSFSLITIVLGIYTIFLTYKHHLKDEMINLFNRPGIYIFALLFFAFAFFSRNAVFYIWDEFTFWSISTKNMYNLDNFYVLPGTTLYIFYPPSPSLFQYFFCKTIMKYSQGIELFTCYMLGFSLMLPMLKNISIKNKKRSLIVLASMLIIPSIFCNNNFYQTIYVDAFLGILAGYIYIEYFSNDNSKFKLVEIMLALFVLSCTKPTGFIMSGIIIFTFIVEKIFKIKNKKLYFEKPSKELIIKLFALFATIFIAFLSWRIYLKLNLSVYNNGYNNNMYQNTNTIKDMFKCIFDTTIGTGVVDNKTFRNFADHFFDSKVFVSKPFQIYGSTLICLFIIGFYYLYKRLNDKDEFIKKSIVYLIYMILYVAFIQVAYYLIFATNEAVAHSSLERYIGTACVTLMIVLYAELFLNKNINKINECIFSFFIVLLILAPYNVIFDATITSASHNAEMQAGISNQRAFADYIKSRTSENDRIFAIHQTQSLDSWFIQFRYFMTPRMIPMIDSFSDNELYQFGKFETVNDLEKELYDKYDYVVIIVTDEYLNENFSSIFEENKIESWSLYKIVKSDDKSVVLKRVE